MNRRVWQETALALFVIVAAVAAMLWIISPADAGQRRASAGAVESESEAVPHVTPADKAALAALADSVAELNAKVSELERTRIFRKPSNPPEEKPDPNNPNAPKSPTEPPQFEFPSTPETDSDPAAIKDWTPEQWKSFFDTVIYLITAIVGLFGGGAAGGLFAKVRQST